MDALRRTYSRGRERLKHTKEKFKKKAIQDASALVAGSQEEPTRDNASRTSSSVLHPASIEQTAELQAGAIANISGPSEATRRPALENPIGISRSNRDHPEAETISELHREYTFTCSFISTILKEEHFYIGSGHEPEVFPGPNDTTAVHSKLLREVSKP
jgi:hypothetical protein